MRARARKRAIIDAHKARPCVDCGGEFPTCAMQFDHRDPAEKRHNVSQMLAYGYDAIEAEVAKCDVVCANCHAIRTWGCSRA